MNRSLRYVLLALLWSAVAGYLCFAGAMAVRGRAKRTVSRVEIEVVDSTSRGCLVSTMRARMDRPQRNSRSARQLMRWTCGASNG